MNKLSKLLATGNIKAYSEAIDREAKEYAQNYIKDLFEKGRISLGLYERLICQKKK